MFDRLYRLTVPLGRGMPLLSIAVISILAVIRFDQADASSSDAHLTNFSQPITSPHRPPEFIQDYSPGFCSSDTKPIYVPPVVAYYPFSTHEVWAIVGDFYNISWINPTTKTQGEGPDNVIGAIRRQQGYPFGRIEILSAYYAGEAPNNQGFFGQMSNYTPDIILTAPGWMCEMTRPVLTMVPACDRKAAQLGFYLTYCMGSNRSAQTPGFDEVAASAELSESAFKGSAAVLANVWKELDGSRGTAFNSTGSCAAVSAYQEQNK